MKYIIMTDPNNFLLNTDGKIIEFSRFDMARIEYNLGDVIIPIPEYTNVEDYQNGKLRLPIFNRSGIRDGK